MLLEVLLIECGGFMCWYVHMWTCGCSSFEGLFGWQGDVVMYIVLEKLYACNGGLLG